MTELPRASCPNCGRKVALRRGGELRAHSDRGGEPCHAAALTVEQAASAITGAVQLIRQGASEAERIAEAFHRTYERLAPEFGWRSPPAWADVPERQRRLLTATFRQLLRDGMIWAA